MRRATPEINASSVADLAFLLLIFFLVTTTMNVDSGISRTLPQMPPKNQDMSNIKVKERNLLVVLINRDDKLLVGGEMMEASQLTDKVKTFILNANKSDKLPEKTIKDIPFFGKQEVSKGIISLQNDVGTSYGKYIEIQDAIARAFSSIRDEKSLAKWGKRYADLSDDQRAAIKSLIPMVISEAEPKKIR